MIVPVSNGTARNKLPIHEVDDLDNSNSFKNSINNNPNENVAPSAMAEMTAAAKTTIQPHPPSGILLEIVMVILNYLC